MVKYSIALWIIHLYVPEVYVDPFNIINICYFTFLDLSMVGGLVCSVSSPQPTENKDVPVNRALTRQDALLKFNMSV